MATVVMMYILPMLLGQTYDIGKERPGLPIFPSTVEKDAVRVEQYATDSQYRMVENAAQVKDFLDVSGKLSLKIKSGLLDVTGEGSYLKDSSSKSNGMEILVKLHFETVTRTIPSSVKPNADWSMLNKKFLGTHFCRSITYGGDLIASIRLSASNTFDLERIKGAINGGINPGSGSFKASVEAKLEMLKQNAQDSSSLEIDYYATVPLQGVSHDVEGLLRLIEEFPQHVKKVNNGTGNPLRMELFPLSSLNQELPVYFENRALTDQLEDLESQFDDLRETRRKIGIWATALPPVTPKGVEEKIQKFTDKVNEIFGVYLKTIAVLDVSKGASTQPLEDALAAYRGVDDYVMPQKYVRQLTSLQNDIYAVYKELKPPVGGALFTRWGRRKCPDPSTEEATVTGVMVTSDFGERGSSSNYLCSNVDPANPDPTGYFPGYPGDDEPDDHLFVSPIRYLGEAQRFQHMFMKQVACASCRAGSRNTVLVKMADTRCPSAEWTMEYTGVLMANGWDSQQGEFVCVDAAMEEPEGEVKFGSSDASMLPEVQEVTVQCGPIPCPPYEEGEPVPCVVCTI